jgi:polysaccharide biosynthesis transport protein
MFKMLNTTQSGDQVAKLDTAFQTIGSFDLANIIGIFLRQWKLAMAICAAILLLTSALLSQLSYRYTAEALVTIDERESQLAGQQDAIGVGVTLNNRVDTEVEIIASNSVMFDAVDRLALWRDPEFGLGTISYMQKLKGVVGIAAPTPENQVEATRLADLEPQLQTQLISKLSRAIKVQRRGLTSVIAITATSKDREKSARIANTISESYLDVQIGAKARTAQRAAEFLNARVNDIAKDIQTVEAQIENFIIAQSSKIGTPEARDEMDRLRKSLENITSTEAGFATELSRMANYKDNLDAMSPNSVPGALRALAEERAALMQKASANAAAPNLARDLAKIDEKLVAALSEQVDVMQEQLATNDKQKIELRKQLQDLFNRQQIPTEVSVSLYRLQREADSKRKLYENFSVRLGEVQQQVEFAVPSSRIVSPAIVPDRPSFPPSLKALALAGLLGLGLGTAAAVAREHLVGGFASPAQFEAVTGLPVAATVPRYEGTAPHNAIVDAPFSSYAESIRRLRLSVEDRTIGLTTKTVIVTSTEPNEGKSTIAVSLARACAVSGYSTILVDCDLRHPSVGKLMTTEAPIGLLQALYDADSNAEILPSLAYEEETGLYVLTTKPSEKQASDALLGSTQFKDLLDKIKKHFNYVIIDSPPIGYVVDARLIATQANALIYVVKQNATTQMESIAGMRQFVGREDCPPLTVVLNDVHTALGSYYYRNSKYSKYYKSGV